MLYTIIFSVLWVAILGYLLLRLIMPVTRYKNLTELTTAEHISIHNNGGQDKIQRRDSMFKIIREKFQRQNIKKALVIVVFMLLLLGGLWAFMLYDFVVVPLLIVVACIFAWMGAKSYQAWKSKKPTAVILCSPISFKRKQMSESRKVKFWHYISTLTQTGHEVNWLYESVELPYMNIRQRYKYIRKAILEADSIHVAWDGQNGELLFYLGMAIAYHKRIILITEMFPKITESDVYGFTAMMYDIGREQGVAKEIEK